MAAVLQSTRMPMTAPSWDEEVVPALRKRLESESRTLAHRLSAISLSSQDGPSFAILSETTLRQLSSPGTSTPTPPLMSTSRRSSTDHTTSASSSRVNGAPATPKGKPQPPSLQHRSRTRSQPYLTDLPNGKTLRTPRSKPNGKAVVPDPRSPAPDPKPTRIPKAARGNPNLSSTPIPAHNGYHDTTPDSFPGLLNETPPFHDPEERLSRRSTDSEERPYEHWYRGEISRNGGVGELKIGKRQEMLDIANYGHTIRAKARAASGHPSLSSSADDDMLSRKRAGSVSGVETKARRRESIFLDADDASRVANVLDEDPPTDFDRYSDIASVSEHPDSHHYPKTGTRGASEDLSTTSVQMPRTSVDDRSTTPTSLSQRPPSRLQNGGPPSRIPGPPSRRSSESRVPTPTQWSRGSTSTEQQHPSPAFNMPSTSANTPTSPHQTSTPLATRPRQQSKPSAARRGTSPGPSALSSTTGTPVPPSTPRKATKTPMKTRAKSAPTKKDLDDEAYRRSVAHYPAPAGDDELMHAIPSWTQPVTRAGNWDDVVLPVVARKKGLDDHYEVADGKPTPKKAVNPVAPAPGTFGFKYRSGRDDSEFIAMDDMGHAFTDKSIIQEEVADQEEPEPAPRLFFPEPKPNLHEQTPLPVRTPLPAHQHLRPPQPPSPPPFSDYAPPSGKVVSSPGGMVVQRMEGEFKVEEEDGGAGCCKCVVM